MNKQYGVYPCDKIRRSNEKDWETNTVITWMNLRNILHEGASCKIPLTAWFHWYEMSRTVKSMVTESRLVVAGGRKKDWLLMDMGFLLGGADNFWNLILMMSTHSMNIPLELELWITKRQRQRNDYSSGSLPTNAHNGYSWVRNLELDPGPHVGVRNPTPWAVTAVAQGSGLGCEHPYQHLCQMATPEGPASKRWVLCCVDCISSRKMLSNLPSQQWVELSSDFISEHFTRWLVIGSLFGISAPGNFTREHIPCSVWCLAHHGLVYNSINIYNYSQKIYAMISTPKIAKDFYKSTQGPPSLAKNHES